MYVPTTILTIGIIAYVIYNAYRRNKVKRILADLVNSYDKVVLHLVSYNLHGRQPKQRDATIKLCAKAICDAASHTVTTKSLLGTTDILSMCKIFQNSFKMRDRLVHPAYEFSKEYDEVLDIVEDTVRDDIKRYFG